MNSPEPIRLDHVDFITIDTVGPPGKRTFFLQAAQDDILLTLIIEKEQAAALSVAIDNLLERLGWEETDPDIQGLDLREPVNPLFRVGQFRLGYDETRDKLLVIARELAGEEAAEPGVNVRILASQEQMAALARQAAARVAAGRPVCQLCHEILEQGQKHVCERGNGRKRLYRETD
jgi:uncharacterized repeat protein (TIGR03847 family)